MATTTESAVSMPSAKAKTSCGSPKRIAHPLMVLSSGKRIRRFGTLTPALCPSLVSSVRWTVTSCPETSRTATTIAGCHCRLSQSKNFRSKRRSFINDSSTSAMARRFRYSCNGFCSGSDASNRRAFSHRERMAPANCPLSCTSRTR